MASRSACGREIGLHPGLERVEIVRRLGGEADEEEARQAAQVDGLEAVAAPVERRRHVVGVDEAAVELVGPLVVGADELADRALGLVDEAGAAVAADVVEGADLPVVVAHDDHGVGAELQRHVVARLRHVRLDADKDPVAAEDHVEVEIVDGAAGVEGRVEAVAGAALGDQRGDVGRDLVEHRRRPEAVRAWAEECSR